MLQVFRVDVAKVDLDVSVLWMLIPDVATICFQMLQMLQLFLAYFFMLQTLILDVADAESRCLQTCVVGCCKYCFSTLQTLRFDVADMWCLGVVLRRRGKRLLMLDVARNTSRNMTAIQSQHGRNMGGEKKDSRCWMLQATAFATFS
jgi:hypothetical protein